MNKTVGNKKDLWHLITRGMLVQLHLDLETTGLEREFAQITAYGDALGDIAGNFINSEEMKVKVPERYLVTTEAIAVVREGIEDLRNPDRMEHTEAMSRIAQRFTTAPQALRALGLPEREIEYSVIRPRKKNAVLRKETIIEYPLMDDDGKEVNHVRYHVESNKISYRFDSDHKSPYYDNVSNDYYKDTDGSKWKLVKARVLNSGYRTKWADLPWLRTNLVRSGFHPRNIFFTHTKSATTSKQAPKNYAVDTYSTVLNTHLFGPAGEEGLKLGRKPGVNGNDGPVSAKLEILMKANTRHENAARGVRAGVFMPDDGSIYNETKAHNSPAYDAKASFAIYNYCRRIAPGIVRDGELQADEQHLRRILPGVDVSSPVPPIYAMMRSNFPHAPTADPVAFLGIDDREGKFGRALMVRLDQDLRKYTYNGKKFADMNSDDFLEMIRKRDGIIRIEPIRKWKGVVPYREALHTPACKDWDLDTIGVFEENFSFLKENKDLYLTMWDAFEMNNRALRNQEAPVNALMEHEWANNGFGNLNVLEADAKKDENERVSGRKARGRGALSGFSEMLYSKVMDEYNNLNMIDESLHLVILQPHPVDYLDSDEALEDYK
ncbi:MAG TPA: hypothetical protein VIF12_07860, partial [Micavibrio sp.]